MRAPIWQYYFEARASARLWNCIRRATWPPRAHSHAHYDHRADLLTLGLCLIVSHDLPEGFRIPLYLPPGSMDQLVKVAEFFPYHSGKHANPYAHVFVTREYVEGETNSGRRPQPDSPGTQQPLLPGLVLPHPRRHDHLCLLRRLRLWRCRDPRRPGRRLAPVRVHRPGVP